MMPIFPKARNAMKNVFTKEIFRAMWDVCPVLKQIRVRPQSEGTESSYERADGRIVETNYNLRKVERRWTTRDAQGLSPEAFLQTATDIGAEMGEKMLADILETVKQATEEVGNVVNCEGKGMTFEKFLEMTAKTYTEFDSFGRPYQKDFLASPETCQQLARNLKDWTSDPAKRAALEQVIDQHRKAFNEREACRRMVD
jgi:hypothetical protein